jgi:NAD+ synthase
MPAETLSIAIAQVNPTVGDLPGNLALIRRARSEAAAMGADLVVFPELVVVGYPPEDLVLRPALVEACHAVIEELASDTLKRGPALLVTGPWAGPDGVYNAAVLIESGRTTVRYKRELPNYGVFDEKRIFATGPLPDVVPFRGFRLGLPICEDIWFPAVTRHLADQGADLLIVPNGSPFEVDKPHARMQLARERVRESGAGLIYVNQVGGQDELVFDGASFALDAHGEIVASLPAWREALSIVRWQKAGEHVQSDRAVEWAPDDRLSTIYNAMMLGLRDYVRKNRFQGVVLGMSGGIDSALTAAAAVDALGGDAVLGVRLPSQFTSRESQNDAAESARLLGMRLETVPIHPAVAALEETLAPLFAGRGRDITEENLQARARGVLLMAMSNKFGHLLVTTGNKSEMSVGYATLYGDMCGGYSVLKDVYKTDVYRVARWRNETKPDMARGPSGRVIPESSLAKAPTAELRPNQTDQDSLPPYDVLDAILIGLVEDQASVEEIAARGLDRATIERVQQLLYIAEYKRRQAPPGVKITRRSFGRDRRYPITNRYREPQALVARE